MTAARFESRQWRYVAIAAAAVLGLVVIVALSRREEAVEVWTAPAIYADLSQQVTTNGTVLPTNEFQARAFWPGIIEKVAVELGQKVKPGQLLVTMKDPFAISRLTAADAALQAARVSNENLRKGGSQEERIAAAGDLQHAEQTQMAAAKSLAALKQLAQKGAASSAEVASAQQRLDAADVTLGTIRARVAERYSPKELKSSGSHVSDAEANLQSAKIQFNNANIASPIAGTVYAVKVVAYDWVPVGTDLVRVADLNHVEIRAYFDEPEIGKLAAGQPVRIEWQGRPSRTWHGHIKQAPIAASAIGSRSVGECVIAVDDAREDLLPNTNVAVTVTIQQHRHVLSILHAALHTSGSENYVFRLVDGRLRRTPVEIGVVNVDRVEVTRGLVEQDLVVLNAADNRELRDGLRARVVMAPSEKSGIVNSVRERLLGLRPH
jgi:HlyD family secretion protein